MVLFTAFRLFDGFELDHEGYTLPVIGMGEKIVAREVDVVSLENVLDSEVLL